MQGKQFLLQSIINYLWFRVSSKSIFEINSKNTEVSIKKVDCPTDSWLIDTYLCNFYSLITTLDSMEKKKLWSSLNWPQIKTCTWLTLRNAENEKPWLLAEAFPDTYTPTHSPNSSHLDLLLSLHVLWSRTNTCYMFCEQLEARNQQWIHFFFPGVWDIHWIWGWEDIDWVLSKHRTIETIKLVINLLLLIPPAFWWNLSKLTVGWIRTVIKHDVNCWALNLYPSSI